MNQRILLSQSIDVLESIVDASSDTQESSYILLTVKHELSFRSTKRSRSLMYSVEQRLSKITLAQKFLSSLLIIPDQNTFTDGAFSLFEWQREALNRWKQKNRRGVIEAVTGSGKTMVGIAAAFEETKRNGKVLVLVPSEELLAQWKIKLNRYIPHARVGGLGAGERDNFHDKDILVGIVNSVRVQPQLWTAKSGLLIADECHRYGSESNKEALLPSFPQRLGLTATYERNDEGIEHFLQPYLGEVCFELNYRRAITEDVVAHFSVALIGVQFNSNEWSEYNNSTDVLNRMKNALVHKFGIPDKPFGTFMKCISQLAKTASYSQETQVARSYLSAFTTRRKILAETMAKVEALSKLKDAIRFAQRTIVFTETIDSANSSAYALNQIGIRASVIHSGLDRTSRQATLKDFGTGKLQVIVAPKILDEGVDVPEADLAIIVATSKTKRQMVQRMGRVLRRKGDGRIARFALLFVENTSEDPRLGAHEDFLEELIGVAEHLEIFLSTTPTTKLCQFLNQVNY